MNQIIQIESLIFSFIYGIFFAFFTRINYKYLNDKKLYFKIIFTIIFTIDNVLLYLYFLIKINSGYVHIYFIICLILGYFLATKKIFLLIKRIPFKKLIEKIKKKCYTYLR